MTSRALFKNIQNSAQLSTRQRDVYDHYMLWQDLHAQDTMNDNNGDSESEGGEIDLDDGRDDMPVV